MGTELSQRDCANSQLQELNSLPISALHFAPGCRDLTPAPRAAFKVQAERCHCLLPEQLIPAAAAALGLPGAGSACSMRLLLRAALLCLALRLGHGSEEAAPGSPGQQDPQAVSSYSDWGIDTIRDGFETVNSYFDSFLEHTMQELLLLDTSRGLSLPVLVKSISREQHKSLLTSQELTGTVFYL